MKKFLQGKTNPLQTYLTATLNINLITMCTHWKLIISRRCMGLVSQNRRIARITLTGFSFKLKLRSTMWDVITLHYMYPNSVILRIISFPSYVISCLRFLLYDLWPPRDHQPTLPLQACSVIRFSRLRFVPLSLSSLHLLTHVAVHVHKHLCLHTLLCFAIFSNSPLFPQPLMLREGCAGWISVSPAVITGIPALFLKQSVHLSHYLSSAVRWSSLAMSMAFFRLQLTIIHFTGAF